jgi:hypothetical protein
VKTIAAVAIVVLLAGCAPVNLDPIMGRTDGTATSTPQKLDCDLIFPAPAQDTLTP